jgi:hypothetical protein
MLGKAKDMEIFLDAVNKESMELPESLTHDWYVLLTNHEKKRYFIMLKNVDYAPNVFIMRVDSSLFGAANYNVFEDEKRYFTETKKASCPEIEYDTELLVRLMHGFQKVSPYRPSSKKYKLGNPTIGQAANINL